MYSAVVPLVGALITLMSGINTRLSGRVGTLVATVVIHVVGLAAVSLILLVKREPFREGRLPAWHYLGGLVGVVTVLSSIYAFAAIGASLAVALALLGQAFASIALDAIGFLGRKKFPLSARRLPGIVLAIAGVIVMSHAVMAGDWRANVPAVLVALLSGATPVISFGLNSELGRRKGTLRSTRANYLVGLAAALLTIAVVRPPVVDAARAIAAAGPVLVLGGGLMGVAVVTSMNFIFPRISAFSATLLLFSGQALAGVLLDAVTEGVFDPWKLVGTFVLLAGLAMDSVLSRRAEAAAPG
jgi:bacterial/archaeal transporter family-2 protein